MTMTRDPLETYGQPREACICGGGGTVFVDEDYVRRHAAAASDGTHATPGLLDALRYSVFPCYECRPDQYKLWSQGCFRPGHTCAQCRPTRRRSGGRRRAAAD